MSDGCRIVCPDCKGSGDYIGFSTRSYCKECCGMGHVEAPATAAQSESSSKEETIISAPLLTQMDFLRKVAPKNARFEFSKLIHGFPMRIPRSAYWIYPCATKYNNGGSWSYFKIDETTTDGAAALASFRRPDPALKDAYAIYRRIKQGSEAETFQDAIYELIEKR